MKYRRLGNCTDDVSAIGLGGMAMTGIYGPADEGAHHEIVFKYGKHDPCSYSYRFLATSIEPSRKYFP